jgi:hypothetical protein
MKRHRLRGALDDEPLEDGDSGFIGVDEREPSLLAPGYVSAAKNYEFRDGVATPRKGVVPLNWSNRGAPFPLEFPIDFTQVVPFGRIWGAGEFKDPDDVEWKVIAADGKVFRLREGRTAAEIPVPAGEELEVEITFEQCLNVLVMFRAGLPQLELESVFIGFRSVVQEANEISGEGTYNPEDGTETIPISKSGLFIQNRLLVPHGDLVSASDFLNYTRYAPVRADFRINQGSSDSLVRLWKFGEASVICFKEQSIYLVGGLYGDLSQTRLEELTDEHGLAAVGAVATVGKDVWYLTSQREVRSITQTEQNKVQGTNAAWSDPMYKTMRRINPRAIGRAKAAFYEGRFYLAVALDESPVNNAVLTYNFTNGAWEGIHQAGGEWMQVKEWLSLPFHGKRRLGYVSESGYLMLWGHSFSDGDGRGLEAIETELLTRGYVMRTRRGEPVAREQKRFTRVRISVSGWNPRYSVTLEADGVAEVSTLAADKTRDRTAWLYPFDRAPWDESNVNDDHGDEGREDYSIFCGDGGEPIELGSGVNFEQHQEFAHGLKVNRRGRIAPVRIVNTQGRLGVKAIELEAVRGSARGGVVAA